MIEFVTLLIIFNIVSFVYVFHVLMYTVKGIHFLDYARNFFLENNEDVEVDCINENDMPAFHDHLLATKGMLYFLIITIMVNLTLMLFALVPELLVTTAGTITKWAAAALNAFNVIALRGFSMVKIDVNATCEGYNVVIQSYDYIEEGEEDDSTD